MADEMLYYEDFEEGREFISAERTVSAEEIIAFASEFDPQPMHLDEAAGKASILGGLSGSGWHMSSLAMRLFFDTVISKSAGEGGPGIDFMEWRKPLIAGDTIRLNVKVKSRRPLASRPGIGLVTMEHLLTNQKGEKVMRMQAPAMLRMRQAQTVEACR
ncbi:MaoC family dehydratase [Rhizobium sp. C1]|uniref:MaoC family dehydratase n=1 Tax=Rhizobium sp. C1 TaxID=1349799 RepID=UPI001E525344|nr:MaoC family dehydratase [Rhizobium sp. C1]MCD2176354.1 MaoC family dehydratase [Rhizobium sp. C1]